MIVTVAVFVSQFAVYKLMAADSPGPVYWDAAQALKFMGIKSGDRLAVFPPEPFGEGGTFVARLDRAKIIVESRETEGEWSKDLVTAARLTGLLQKAGVTAALCYGDPPANSVIPWQRLGKTRYYAYFVSLGNVPTVPR
jgi:hypothetical protein